MRPPCFRFAWRIAWAGTLKDYWSTVIASMGGTLISGRFVASHSVVLPLDTRTIAWTLLAAIPAR